ncbi:ATP-binding protein [Thermosipho ferrireducens]|uniref:ATP-binding protein n=1 Tax=Thermosipho ferrireducens TaxID=2571116 RepID=A0ABX7S7A0_9BACT|nr:ATP-binding protein [Thermosipho ferrireducens]QTA38467.1 ATP-binding protein [Thermosipho ferrireducens]
MFINRDKEKNFLRRKLSSKRSELLIIYGRRRVGKTFLLEHVIKNGLFFTADLSGSVPLMNRFLNEIKELINLPESLKINSWEEFFSFLDMAINTRKINTVVIDEFQYIPYKDDSFLSIFQRWWDKNFSKKDVKFILCGSYSGMIEKIALSQNSPIYGRRTGQYKILPMNFEDSVKFFNFDSKQDYVLAYSVTDGVPLYLLEFSKYTNFFDALKEKILTPGEFLVEEGKFLTLEEFKKDPSNYFSILTAIANGKTTPNEIANESGMEYKSIGTYLSRLLELELIKKEQPFSLKKAKKKAFYYINDEYLRFYFRYIYPHQEMIYRGLGSKLLEKIKTTLSQHVSFTFEKISKQYFEKHTGIEKAGRWWGAGNEIDIVGVKDNTLYVGECKWTNKKIDGKILNSLKRKIPYLLKDLEYEPVKIIYYLFSKNGFEGLKESDDVKLITLDNIIH